jgi:hypothetical protein
VSFCYVSCGFIVWCIDYSAYAHQTMNDFGPEIMNQFHPSNSIGAIILFKKLSVEEI